MGSRTELVERYFDHLTARSWESLAALLSVDVERVGPFGDLAVGRDRYVSFLEATVPADYRNDVLRVVYAPDNRAAFARVSEHLRYPEQEFHLEEVYAFDIGDDGLISRVEIYWQTPELDPGGFGSAGSDESYVNKER